MWDKLDLRHRAALQYQEDFTMNNQNKNQNKNQNSNRNTNQNETENSKNSR